MNIIYWEEGAHWWTRSYPGKEPCSNLPTRSKYLEYCKKEEEKDNLVRIVTRDLTVKWNKYLLVIKYLKGSSCLASHLLPEFLKRKYALELDVFIEVHVCVLACVCVCVSAGCGFVFCDSHRNNRFWIIWEINEDLPRTRGVTSLQRKRKKLKELFKAVAAPIYFLSDKKKGPPLSFVVHQDGWLKSD